jgi:hypothetical protein
VKCAAFDYASVLLLLLLLLQLDQGCLSEWHP